MALETPKYKVIEKDSNIEIRFYEKFTVAKTNVQNNFAHFVGPAQDHTVLYKPIWTRLAEQMFQNDIH